MSGIISFANNDCTGLGLYVAKQIVEAHGGKIWAESAGKGLGSQFIVEMEEKKG
ncbi:MAG: ATP-binding protein [Candidatus Paceibacterota bacterium]|jgi:signal transduction histidine kinase